MRRSWTLEVGSWPSALLGWGLLLALTATAEAATYYVAPAPTGNDSRTCPQAQNPATPRQTVTAAANCLAPGDTLRVASGVYGGASVQNPNIPSGTASASTTMSCESGAIFRPTSGTHVFSMQFSSRSVEYIIVEGCEFDAVNLIGHGVRFNRSDNPNEVPRSIIFRNNTIRNTQHSGMSTGGCINCEIRGNLFSRAPVVTIDGRNHGIYLVAKNTLITGNRFIDGGSDAIAYNCHWGPVPIPQCVSGLTGGNNSVVGNYFESNCKSPLGNTYQMTVSQGLWEYDALVANNIFVKGTGNCLVGVNVGGGTLRTRVYNNTIDGHNIGIRLLSGGGRDAAVRNNILYNNVTPIQDQGATNPTVSLNLCGSSGIGCAVVGNPLFIDTASNNFHLQSISPAIDAGTALPDVPQDFECTPRPQGLGYDIGADEFGPPGASCGGAGLPGDLNVDGVRNLTDVRWLIEMLVGRRSKTTAADLNHDGNVTLADCQALIKLLVGIP